jgi:ribonuclease Z
MGLLFTFHLMGRKKPLYLYGQKGLQDIITLQLKYSDTRLNYDLEFIQLDPTRQNLILQDDKIEVYSFPLNHRIPCCGFLFREKPKPFKINKEKLPAGMNFSAIQILKRGEDVFDENGQLVYSASELTLPPRTSRSYAFCSDTSYLESLIPMVRNVDLLYHEATFLNSREEWAKSTYHSTTAQAATLAKKAGVRKLLIGHFSARYKDLTPFLEEAREIFEESYLAIEGETHELIEQ